MKKALISTSCRVDEAWTAVLDVSFPRFREYAKENGYDFIPIWYDGLSPILEHDFTHPDRFLDGVINYEQRKDFILWKLNRDLLAPNWLRYAWTVQLLEKYDVVLYLDGDVIVNTKDDVLDAVPEDSWLACPVNGPSPDNAGPGGPMYLARSGDRSIDFWRRVWNGQLWKTHPSWTDGVDFMALLGYSISEPVHKIRDSEYDFFTIPHEWMVWRGQGQVEKGKMYHIGGGNGDPIGKAALMRRIVVEIEGEMK